MKLHCRHKPEVAQNAHADGGDRCALARRPLSFMGLNFVRTPPHSESPAETAGCQKCVCLNVVFLDPNYLVRAAGIQLYESPKNANRNICLSC
jgi:hypothetical protein